jgi:hypothetical protein
VAQYSAAQTNQTIADPLAFWNDGPAKEAIRNFVRVTTDPSSRAFVSPENRIAIFD